MTDDLQAARERWKRYDTAYNGDDDPQESDDAYTLADAYLLLHDETPITEECEYEIPLPQSWTMRQYVDVRPGRVRLCAESRDATTGMSMTTYIQLPINTVGQLRALLLAMEVTHES